MCQWQSKAFAELSVGELYAIIQLRERVFVVEQSCAYLECDGHDPFCFHLIGKSRDTLVAYGRVAPPQRIYTEPAIGRVVIAKAARGKGLGTELVLRCIAQAEKAYGKTALRIGAQNHLQSMYRQLGFRPVGEPYDEDGILHVQMLRC